MNLNEYQLAAMRTMRTNIVFVHHKGEESTPSGMDGRIVNGVMGLNGEAGEAIDIVKKTLFQGHEFDPEHLKKELGDCLFYIAATASGLGTPLEEIAQMNIDKLRARYKDGFTVEESVNRKNGDI